MLQSYEEKYVCLKLRKVQSHRKRLNITPPVFAETPGHQEYDNLTTKLGRKQLEEAFATCSMQSLKIIKNQEDSLTAKMLF